MILQLIKRGVWTLYAVASESRCDLLDFLTETPGDKLGKEKGRMLVLLDRVADMGPPRNTEISHQISDGIWQFSHGSIRVLWFYDAGRLIICSHAFPKKGQKTPAGEIERAKEALRTYRESKTRGALRFEED